MDILHTNDLKKNKTITYDNLKFYDCEPTDLAIITGVSLLKIDKCMPFIKSDNKYYAMVGKYGYLQMSDNLKEGVVLRPVLMYKELDEKLVKNSKRLSNNIYTFTYGNFPQTLIKGTLQEILKRKYIKNKLKTAENIYHFYIDGKMIEFPVYKYDGIKFIVVNIKNELFFIEENPLEFMTVPGDTGKSIAVKGLLSNIPFLINESSNDNSLYEFLNNTLLNDIINNKTIKKQKTYNK